MSTPSIIAWNAWREAHEHVAFKEGWMIKRCSPPGDISDSDFVYQLRSTSSIVEERDAALRAMQGVKPHHVAARDFLRRYDPAEWKLQCSDLLGQGLTGLPSDVITGITFVRMLG
jgi:hypothetical protein